jgi:hypothetical protein
LSAGLAPVTAGSITETTKNKRIRPSDKLFLLFIWGPPFDAYAQEIAILKTKKITSFLCIENS